MFEWDLATINSYVQGKEDSSFRTYFRRSRRRSCFTNLIDVVSRSLDCELVITDMFFLCLWMNTREENRNVRARGNTNGLFNLFYCYWSIVRTSDLGRGSSQLIPWKLRKKNEYPVLYCITTVKQKFHKTYLKTSETFCIFSYLFRR